MAPGEVIAEIETDKATAELEAESGGILHEILIPAGTENVAVGTVIAVLREAGDAPVVEAPARRPEAELRLVPSPAPERDAAAPSLAPEHASGAPPLRSSVIPPRRLSRSNVTLPRRRWRVAWPRGQGSRWAPSAAAVTAGASGRPTSRPPSAMSLPRPHRRCRRRRLPSLRRPGTSSPIRACDASRRVAWPRPSARSPTSTCASSVAWMRCSIAGAGSRRARPTASSRSTTS